MMSFYILHYPDYESISGAVKIGDDFWGVGQITISPGVTIGNKVIALTKLVSDGGLLKKISDLSQKPLEIFRFLI